MWGPNGYAKWCASGRAPKAGCIAFSRSFPEWGEMMQWSEVLSDPSLRNLPYKVELNEWGKIVLTPASNKHGLLQAEISGYLRQNKPDGKVLTECSIDTPKGVKVADVAWGSSEFFKRNGFDTPYRSAPELCVEIVSPSNSKGEIDEKIALYLGKGAREVWVCTEDGLLEVFAESGKIAHSAIFVGTPRHFTF